MVRYTREGLYNAISRDESRSKIIKQAKYLRDRGEISKQEYQSIYAGTTPTTMRRPSTAAQVLGRDEGYTQYVQSVQQKKAQPQVEQPKTIKEPVGKGTPTQYFTTETIEMQERPRSYLEPQDTSRYEVVDGKVVGVQDSVRGMSYATQPTSLSELSRIRQEQVGSQVIKEERRQAGLTRYDRIKEASEADKGVYTTADRFYKGQGYKGGEPAGTTLGFFGLVPDYQVKTSGSTFIDQITPRAVSYKFNRLITQEEDKQLRYEARGEYGLGYATSFGKQVGYGLLKAPFDLAQRPVEVATFIIGGSLLGSAASQAGAGAAAYSSSPYVTSLGLISVGTAASIQKSRSEGGTGASQLGAGIFYGGTAISAIKGSQARAARRAEELTRDIRYNTVVKGGEGYRQGITFDRKGRLSGKIALVDTQATYQGKPAQATKLFEFKAGRVIGSREIIRSGDTLTKIISSTSGSSVEVFKGGRLRFSDASIYQNYVPPTISNIRGRMPRVVDYEGRVGRIGKEIVFREGSYASSTAKSPGREFSIRIDTNYERFARASNALVATTSREGGKLTYKLDTIEPTFVFGEKVQYQPYSVDVQQANIAKALSTSNIKRIVSIPTQPFEINTAVRTVTISARSFNVPYRPRPITDYVKFLDIGKSGQAYFSGRALSSPSVSGGGSLRTVTRTDLPGYEYTFGRLSPTVPVSFNIGTSILGTSASSVSGLGIAGLSFLQLTSSSSSSRLATSPISRSALSPVSVAGLSPISQARIEAAPISDTVISQAQISSISQAQIPQSKLATSPISVSPSVISPGAGLPGLPSTPIQTKPFIPPDLFSLSFAIPKKGKRGGTGRGSKSILAYRPSLRGITLKLKTPRLRTAKLTGLEVRGF